MKIGSGYHKNFFTAGMRQWGLLACVIGWVMTLAACGSGPGYSYTVGGTVSGLTGTVVLQNNGGDDLTITANGSFSMPHAVTNGDTYNVTVLQVTSAMNQTCTVANASGTVSGMVTNVQVNCLQPPPRLAIDSAATVAAAIKYSGTTTTPFKIEASGLLTVKTALSAGTNPNSVTIADIGAKKIVYVANFGTATTAGSVSVYEMNPSTGALTTVEVPSAAVIATRPYSISVLDDQYGQRAYILDWGSNNLYIHGIDPATGALQNTVDNPNNQVLDTGLNPSYVDVRQIGTTGTYVLFVVKSGEEKIRVRRSLSGAPWSNTGFTATGNIGANPGPVLIDPVAGAYAHVVNVGSNSISVLSIKPNGTDIGSVSLLATVATGSSPITLVTDEDRKFAYVPNFRGNSISVYGIGTDGNLSPGTAVGTGTSPYAMATVKIVDGATTYMYAYVANYNSNNLSAYRIETTGALTPLATPTVPAGTNPYQLIYKAITSGGTTKYLLYVLHADSDNTVYVYEITKATGVLEKKQQFPAPPAP